MRWVRRPRPGPMADDAFDLQRFVDAQAPVIGRVRATRGRSAHEIFGSPDDLKLRSSMTLFAHAAPDEPLFRRVLERF